MTEEEKLAEEYIEKNKEDNFLNFGEDIKIDLSLVKKQAFLAGLEAGKPKWHNLLIDPNDLPKENIGLLLTKTNKGAYRLDMFINNRFMLDMKITKTIGWCEIPKFKEE